MRIPMLLTFLFVCGLCLLFQKYYLFGYVDWDLAFFSQASWNLMHGGQFVSLVGINYFGDHSYFIHFFILPFYYLFPTPLTLLVLKLAAFLVAAYFLYHAAEERLGGVPALLVMLLYLFFPGNFFGLLYEFNPEAFAPPFIVLMFMALHKKQFRRMMFWAVFLMLIKENMFFVAAAFGARAAFIAEARERKWCVLFTCACLALFVYSAVVLIPHFRGLGHHAFSVRYAWLGNNIQEMLLTPLLQPQELWKRVFYENYLVHLFNYLLIPAILSPLALFMMAPLLLQHLLSGSRPEHSIFYHYVPAMAPFIFFAFIETLYKMKQSPRLNQGLYPLLLLLAAVSVPVLVAYRQEAMVRDWNVMDRQRAATACQLVDLIPPEAGVITTFRFLAPLSSRSELYSFHMLYGDEFNDLDKMGKIELNTRQAFRLSDQVTYALIDLEDPWYLSTLELARESEMKRINDFFNDPRWKVIKSADRMLLLERGVPDR